MTREGPEGGTVIITTLILAGLHQYHVQHPKTAHVAWHILGAVGGSPETVGRQESGPIRSGAYSSRILDEVSNHLPTFRPHKAQGNSGLPSRIVYPRFNLKCYQVTNSCDFVTVLAKQKPVSHVTPSVTMFKIAV